MGMTSTSVSPHKYNEAGELEVYNAESVKTITFDFAGAQTDTTILTPSAGKKLEITGVYVSANDKNTDVSANFLTSSIVVYKLYTTNQQTGSEADVHLDGAINEVLSFTCGAGTFVAVRYYEH